MPDPHKPTEFVRMSAEEFRHLYATGQAPQRGTAHPQGTRCKEDGIGFDSKTERDFYRHLKRLMKTQPCPGDYIDVHPVFTLPGGIRFTADFLFYCPGARHPQPGNVYDVKGRKPDSDFWRLKKLFDATHPLAPLRVVRRVNGTWVEVESAREWE